MLRDGLDLSLENASWCIMLMAAFGAVGSYIPACLPFGALTALQASLGPLLLAAGCLSYAGLFRSNYLAWCMACTCFAEVVVWTPYVSSICQFTEGIEDIAGSAASLLTALSFLGSSFVSLLVVARLTLASQPFFFVCANRRESLP